MKYIKLFDSFIFEDEFYKKVIGDIIFGKKVGNVIYRNGIGAKFNRKVSIEGKETHTDSISDDERNKILSFDDNLYPSMHQSDDPFQLNLCWDFKKYVLSLKRKEKSLDWSDPRLRGMHLSTLLVIKLVDEYYILEIGKSNLSVGSYQTYLCDQMEGLEKCIRDSHFLYPNTSLVI